MGVPSPSPPLNTDSRTGTRHLGPNAGVSLTPFPIHRITLRLMSPPPLMPLAVISASWAPRLPLLGLRHGPAPALRALAPFASGAHRLQRHPSLMALAPGAAHNVTLHRHPGCYVRLDLLRGLDARRASPCNAHVAGAPRVRVFQEIIK